MQPDAEPATGGAAVSLDVTAVAVGVTFLCGGLPITLASYLDLLIGLADLLLIGLYVGTTAAIVALYLAGRVRGLPPLLLVTGYSGLCTATTIGLSVLTYGLLAALFGVP